MSKTGVYAIIGRGFSAAVNLSTLLLTDFGRRRIDGRQVVLIGQSDLWSDLYPHRMGQAGKLLALPGFMEQPDDAGFLSSEEFERIISTQYARLLGAGLAQPLDRIVQSIRIANSGFEIDAAEGLITEAGMIDVCIGPGIASTRMNVMLPSSLTKELLEPPGRPKRIYSGHSFLNRHQIFNDGVVCIVGGGPVGSLCCERAIASGRASVIWVNLGDFALAFPPGGRFDYLATKSSVGWTPEHANLQIAGGYALSTVELKSRRVALTFTPNGDEQWYLSKQGSLGTLSDATCDSLVLAYGVQNDVDRLFSDFTGYREIISKDLGLTVGLEKFGGSIRILGAAATNHDFFWQLADQRYGNPLRTYIQSLSRQIQLPPDRKNISILLNARLVAEANNYFSEHAKVSGPNWNAALISNVKRCLRRGGVDLSDESFSNICQSRVAEVLSTLPVDAHGIGDVIYSRRALQEFSAAPR